MAAGRADWLLAGATEAALDDGEPGAEESEAGAAALILEPADVVAARGGTALGRVAARSFFLPPRVAASASGARRAGELLGGALRALDHGEPALLGGESAGRRSPPCSTTRRWPRRWPRRWRRGRHRHARARARGMPGTGDTDRRRPRRRRPYAHRGGHRRGRGQRRREPDRPARARAVAAVGAAAGPSGPDGAPMTTSLEGSWALILGASSGMGLATAYELAREGSTSSVSPSTPPRGRRRPRWRWRRSAASGCGPTSSTPTPPPPGPARSWSPVRRADRRRGRADSAALARVRHAPAVRPRRRRARPGPRQMTMTLDVMAHSLVYWTQDLHAAGLLRRGAKVYAMTSTGGSRVLPSTGRRRRQGRPGGARTPTRRGTRPEGVAVNALRAGVTPPRPCGASPAATGSPSTRSA
ncbi:hypothetical protein NKH77_20445 [Streptomyces sp. M19]